MTEFICFVQILGYFGTDMLPDMQHYVNMRITGPYS